MEVSILKIDGTEIDFTKQRGYFFQMDCMDALKQMPDKSVSLAIVDPPYGAGFTEGGGCQGWFSKYHQDEKPIDNKELGAHFHGRGRSKRYQEAYNDESSQFCQVERERERRRSRGTGSADDLIVTKKTHYTNGMRKCRKNYQKVLETATEMRKKSYRGTLPRIRNTLKNFSVSHEIRLYGAVTTLNFHLQDAFWYGVS